MTDQNTPENNSSEQNTPEKKKFISTTKGKVAAVFLGASVLVGGVAGYHAIADTKTYQHAKVEKNWGGKHSRMNFSKMTDEQIETRVDRMAQHVAIEIEATPEQTEKIKTAALAIALDMKAQNEAWKEAGSAMKDMLLSDNVNRAQLETIRQQRLAEADRMSQKVVAALADVSEVLTAEQRADLAERIEKMQSRRGRR